MSAGERLTVIRFEGNAIAMDERAERTRSLASETALSGRPTIEKLGKCGYMTDPARACARVPVCGEDYLSRISGPLMDRFDLRVEVPPVAYTDLDLPATGEPSAMVAERVKAARDIQAERFEGHPNMRVNADAEGAVLEEIATPDSESRDLLARVAERFGLTARGYHRVLRVARTIADLDKSSVVRRPHIAEAVSYRVAVAKKA